MSKFIYAITLMFMFCVTGYASAVDHSEMIEGPFTDVREVTKKCLECHEEVGHDILKTNHWNWGGIPNGVEGMEKVTKIYGKVNMLNNFCISAEGGVEPNNKKKCANCHIGYGWDGKNEFDHNNPENIDCLVCHTKTPIYFNAKKTGIGGIPNQAIIDSGVLDLTKAAQSVSMPNLTNCGTCHFYGGGADAVKHGELDSSLYRADKNLDVHMGGAGLTCIDCHKSENHKISGFSTLLASHEGRSTCESCHADQHKDNYRLYEHTKTIACATCHVPEYGRGQAVKIMWDWSTAGKDIEDPEIQYDKEAYEKIKGDFKWGMNVQPVYEWFNGKVYRYLNGDKINPDEITYISKPAGKKDDQVSKITPFKVHDGKQPYDKKYLHLLTPHTVEGYWQNFDWEKALIEGGKGTGPKYSGSYEFAPTEMYIQVAHQVAPKEKSLQCADCHFEGKRMNWKALGYKGDPMFAGSK